jgi:hypothetical protein
MDVKTCTWLREREFAVGIAIFKIKAPRGKTTHIFCLIGIDG